MAKSAEAAQKVDPKEWDNAAIAYCEQRGTSPAWMMEIPVLKRILGDLRGKRVLHAGCGGGHLTFLTHDLGGIAVGIDSSEAMISYAAAERDRRGIDPQAVIFIPMDVMDSEMAVLHGKVHVVVCDLFNNVEDPAKVLDVLKRVIMQGGQLVVLLQHPLRSAKSRDESDVEHMRRTDNIVVKDYLQERPNVNKWNFDGKTNWEVTTYHRPIEYYVELLATNGFRITGMTATRPVPGIEPRNDYDRVVLKRPYDPTTLVISAIKE